MKRVFCLKAKSLIINRTSHNPRTGKSSAHETRTVLYRIVYHYIIPVARTAARLLIVEDYHSRTGLYGMFAFLLGKKFVQR